MHDWTSYNEFTEDFLWRCKSNSSDINKNPSPQTGCQHLRKCPIQVRNQNSLSDIGRIL